MATKLDHRGTDLLLDMSVWPYALLAIVLLYYLIQTTRSYLRLKQFRGPWLASFSNLWYIRAANSTKSHLYFQDVCEKYGE